MSEEGGRRLLDDRGRVFGVVNVVDALVVVIILAVVVAGVGLVLSSGEDGEPDAGPGAAGESATWYVTLEMEPQPASSAQQVAPGEELRVSETNDALLITDVYRYDTSSGTAVVARAAVDGRLVESDDPEGEPTFEFRGEPLHPGQSFDIVTGGDERTATVTHLDRSGETLPLADSEFVLEAHVSAATGAELAVGDEFTAGGESVGEITALERFPAGDGEYALVGVTATILERGGSQFLGDARLAIGTLLSFDGDSYTLDGEVVQTGTSAIETERHEFLLQTDVPATVAGEVHAGDEFRIGDVPVVTVEAVTVYPTGDPDVRRVVLGVSALTRTEGSAVLFGDKPVRVGSTLPVTTDAYDIEGEVVRRGSLEAPGTPTTQTVTLRLADVPPERADSLAAGLTEQARDNVTAEVQAVTTAPAEVVVESADGNVHLREHPTRKDVELTVDLSVREREDGSIRFRGEPLRTGQTLTLELGSVTIDGELVELHG